MPVSQPLCSSCQAPLPEGAAFCPACGKPTPTSFLGGKAAVPEHPDLDREEEYRERLGRAMGQDYELRELIGRGGFGAVYAAWDVRLEREVAVKALRHDLFPTPELLARFQGEAKAVAKLRHPNILPVFTVGEGDGIAFMVMPRVEGRSLRTALDEGEGLETAEAVRIIVAVAKALAAAHRRDLIHRDVKPENIMLEEEGNVLLMDFGIAKAVSAPGTGLTGTGLVVGSPSYMSPEQARGETNVDHRADLYALGAVAFELLTGERPIQAGNLHELVYKQVTEEVPTVASLAPEVPAAVGDIVMRCLAKDPAERWASASDVAEALESAVRGEEIRGMAPEAPWEESWLGRKGPYLLLLLFLAHGVQYLELFVDPAIVPYVATSLKVLMIVAGLDFMVSAGLRRRRGASWGEVARSALGQPSWWQLWWPLSLQFPGRVWERLSFPVKVLRTVVWLQIMLLPAGFPLMVFVVPTFWSMYRSLGMDLPFAMNAAVELSRWYQAYWFFLASVELALLIWIARKVGVGTRNLELPLNAVFRTLQSDFWKTPEAEPFLTGGSRD